MFNRRHVFYAVFLFASSSLLFSFQAPAQSAPSLGVIPKMVKFSGAAPVGTSSVSFAIYDRQDSLAPLWLETQTVTGDASGHYSVLLGSTKADGLPASIFASGEARWIGVTVEGGQEQPRTLLVSVPYALKAGDAETLGGKPLSAFVLADGLGKSSSLRSISQAQRVLTATGDVGTQNFLGKFDSSNVNLISSQVFDNGTNVGIGTSTPGNKLDVAGTIRSTDTTESINSNVGSILTLGGLGVAKTGYFGVGIVLESQNAASFIYGTSGFSTRGSSLASSAGTSGNYNGTFFNNNGVGAGDNGNQLNVGLPSWRMALGGGGAEWNGADNFSIARVAAGGNFLAPSIFLKVTNAGNVGIGTTTPATALDVVGQVHASGGFKFGDGSVQTSAAVGTLTGVTTAAGSGLLGGATSGNPSLSLVSCGNAQILQSNGTTWACATPASGGGGITYPYSSGNQSSTSGAFTVTQTNSVVLGGSPTFTQAMSTIPGAVVGIASTTSNSASGVIGFSSSISAPAMVGWNGSTSGSSDSAEGILGITDNPIGTAIEGNANSTTGNNVGVRGQSKSTNGIGVWGFNGTSGSGIGVQAEVDGPTGTGLLVKSNNGGVAAEFDFLGSSGNILVAKSAGNTKMTLDFTGALTSDTIHTTGGTPSIIGTGGLTINGPLIANGTVSKPMGSFKIDHPLDPAGKYLYHSFVESPDMMNIYNGVVTLDAKGQAWITMADYFEALNMDFRYQLTAMGRPAPYLYVSKEMAGNRFKISGGPAHGKVSWQVTGIRHDAYADAHRIQVEVEKPAAEQGTYLHPELFGKDASKGLYASADHK